MSHCTPPRQVLEFWSDFRRDFAAGLLLFVNKENASAIRVNPYLANLRY